MPATRLSARNSESISGRFARSRLQSKKTCTDDDNRQEGSQSAMQGRKVRMTSVAITLLSGVRRHRRCLGEPGTRRLAKCPLRHPEERIWFGRILTTLRCGRILTLALWCRPSQASTDSLTRLTSRRCRLSSNFGGYAHVL